MPQELDNVRNQIDQIDRQILSLLEQRLQLAEQVASIKERQQSPVELTDPLREQAIIEKLQLATTHEVLRAEVKNIFSICMEMSKKIRITRRQQDRNRYLPALTLGIIGHGHFGKLLANTFRTYWSQSELLVYSPECTPNEDLFCSLEQVCQADLLFLCVPISQLSSALHTIRPFLSPNTTVLDVCSVKKYAAELMQQLLPPQTPIIATHPMFGPQSSREGTDFYGLNLVIHNISAPDFVYNTLVRFWENMGVKIVEMNPEEHDKHAAYSINYNHLVGRIGERIGLQTTPIDTRGFRVIFDALQYVTHDTWELFQDMQNHNPFAQEMREKVREAIEQIEAKLLATSHQETPE